MQRWVVTSWIFEILSHLLFCSLFLWEPLLPPHLQPTGLGAGRGAEDRQSLQGLRGGRVSHMLDSGLGIEERYLY